MVIFVTFIGGLVVYEISKNATLKSNAKFEKCDRDKNCNFY